MVEMDPQEVFNELRREVTQYLELRKEDIKLDIYEKLSKTTALLSYGITLLLLSLFAILFLFLTIGFLIGGLLNNLAAGFAIVTFIYVLIILLVVLFRSNIQTAVINAILIALTSNDNNTTTNGKKVD